MFYLSDLIGKKVLDNRGNRIAQVRDIVAELTDATLHRPPLSPASQPSDLQTATGGNLPVIKGVVARSDRRHEPFYISIEQVAHLDDTGVHLRSSRVDLQPFDRRPGEILLTRDLWDKQVIDIQNRRVTRVGDIVITDAIEPIGDYKWLICGVDVSIASLLRRMRLNSLFRVATWKSRPNIIDWQYIEVFGSNVPGGAPFQHTRLAQLHPVEIARITDSISYHQGAEIISSLDDTLAADTLEEMVAERQTDIVEQIPEERAADILEEMSPNAATDLLSDLPEEKAQALLDQMDEDGAREVRYLMRYDENTAGGIMTTDFVFVLPTMTVEQVIEANRHIIASPALFYYMYVVDCEEDLHLIGVITVRDLLVNERDALVSDFMLEDVLTSRPGEREQEVARKMAEYNLLALPVVDDGDVLLGVVTVDDALDAILPEGWKKRLPRIFS